MTPDWPRLRLLLLAALVLAGCGALFAAIGRSDARSLRSFYFEAHLVVDQPDNADSMGLNEPPLDTIRGWYQAPDRWAWDFSDSARPIAGSLQVGDGAEVWYYDRPTNTYSRISYADFFAGRSPGQNDGPQPITGAALIGPVPFGDPERYLAPFATIGRRSDSDGGVVAGRPTRAVSFTRGEEHTTFWLDRQYPLILRYVSHGPDFSVSAEITRLVLNDAIPDAPFPFQPPPRALEVPWPSRGPVQAGGRISPGEYPQGFLSLGYLPAGYRARGQSEENGGAGGSTSRVAVRYQPDASSDGAYLIVEQQYRAGGLDPSLATGSAVPLASGAAYHSQDGSAQVLVWSQGDIVVTLRSNALPLEELVRIANAVHR